ncbi:MAG: hypothetical protein ACXVH7_04780 [Thermoanaerobaculia bacterium]
MRRTSSVTDVLRRGLDSVLANWQLLLMRLAESILFAGIAVASVIAIIIPVVVSAGLSKFDFSNVDDPEELARSILFDHWLIITYVLAGICAILIVFIALHSFVQGGAAEVFVTAERQAGDETVPRKQLEAFTMDRWLRGGARTWWSIFWIYNAAWTVAALIMLAPIVAIGALVILTRGNPAGIIIGCLCLVLTLFVVLIVGVAASIWTQKAIVVVVSGAAGAATALGEGWRQARRDFSRHFAVTFVIFVIAIGSAGLLAMISVGSGMGGRSAGAQFLFLPIRLGVSFVNSFLSAIIGNWLLASFAALSISRDDHV